MARAASDEAAHAVTHDRQLVDRYRPLRDEALEERRELAAVRRNMTAAVVGEIHGRDAEILRERGAVVVANIGTGVSGAIDTVRSAMAGLGRILSAPFKTAQTAIDAVRSAIDAVIRVVGAASPEMSSVFTAPAAAGAEPSTECGRSEMIGMPRPAAEVTVYAPPNACWVTVMPLLPALRPTASLRYAPPMRIASRAAASRPSREVPTSTAPTSPDEAAAGA